MFLTVELIGSPWLGAKANFLSYVLLADIAQRYRISKYPTLKLFRNGMMMKREYRGQRSVKALADYIRQQKSNPVHEIQSLDEVTNLDVSYLWWSVHCLFNQCKRTTMQAQNPRFLLQFITVYLTYTNQEDFVWDSFSTESLMFTKLQIKCVAYSKAVPIDECRQREPEL